MDLARLLTSLARRRVLLAIAIFLGVAALVLVLLPFEAAGPRRDAVELRYERWSCPPPLQAHIDIAGTPYWNWFDPEVPTCVYHAGNRLILAALVGAVGLAALTTHVTTRILRPDQGRRILQHKHTEGDPDS